jgi:uncharacterized protein
MKHKPILRLAFWILLVQFVLINLSAFLYAYRLTHFTEYKGQPAASRGNIISRTWNIFSGPAIYRNTKQELWNDFNSASIGSVEGHNINAWYRNPNGSGAWVIFIHGVTSDKSYFKNEANKFTEWGYNVLVVDLRGHGSSQGKSTSFGVKETAEVKIAFDWVRSKKAQKVILYGSSMGAAVVIKSVADGVVKPDGVVADMAFASLHDHYRSRVKTLGFPKQPFAFLFTFWTGVQQGYNGFSHDVSEYARKVDCPILLQWGDRDHLVKAEETSRIFENIPSKDKRLVVYPGADHHSYLLTHASDWEEQVRNFTDGL